MTNKEIFVNSFDNLKLDIYVVGYPQQGESVLCVLREEDGILFVSLVDSYTPPSPQTNHVAAILDSLGRPPIDMLVWTHPDEDHSLGISVMMNEYDPKHEADVFIPAHLSEIASEDAMKEFNNLLAWYNPTGQGIRPHTYLNEVSMTNGEIRSLFTISLIERATNSAIHMHASFYLPNSSMAIRKAPDWSSARTNEYSVVHSLCFNGQQYLFCGDMTKNNVLFLPERFFSCVKFIKIPHHGSKEPINLAGKMISMGVKDPISATTIYQKGSSDNPDDETVNLYKTFCSNVFSTGKDSRDNYGCIKLTMNSKGDLESHILDGNAVRL